MSGNLKQITGLIFFLTQKLGFQEPPASPALNASFPPESPEHHGAPEPSKNLINCNPTTLVKAHRRRSSQRMLQLKAAYEGTPSPAQTSQAPLKITDVLNSFSESQNTSSLDLVQTIPETKSHSTPPENIVSPVLPVSPPLPAQALKPEPEATMELPPTKSKRHHEKMKKEKAGSQVHPTPTLIEETTKKETSTTNQDFKQTNELITQATEPVLQVESTLKTVEPIPSKKEEDKVCLETTSATSNDTPFVSKWKLQGTPPVERTSESVPNKSQPETCGNAPPKQEDAIVVAIISQPEAVNTEVSPDRKHKHHNSKHRHSPTPPTQETNNVPAINVTPVFPAESTPNGTPEKETVVSQQEENKKVVPLLVLPASRPHESKTAEGESPRRHKPKLQHRHSVSYMPDTVTTVEKETKDTLTISEPVTALISPRHHAKHHRKSSEKERLAQLGCHF